MVHLLNGSLHIYLESWNLSILLPFYTNLSFISFKFFLFLDNLNVKVNIFRGICPSFLSNSSSSWATWTWKSIYSVEFFLNFFQILPLLGLQESDNQYIPWNLSFISFKFFLFLDNSNVPVTTFRRICPVIIPFTCSNYFISCYIILYVKYNYFLLLLQRAFLSLYCMNPVTKRFNLILLKN